MSPSISRDAGSRLASYIEDRRRDIVASVVRSPVLAAPGSMAASVFTSSFLDRLCQELESGDRDLVDVWATTEAEPVEGLELSRLVAIACAVVSSGFVSDCGPSDEVISYLAVRSGELEKRLRRDRTGLVKQIDPAKLVSRDEVVASLLSAIDARDAATCEHSRAVGMWCNRIAKTLGFSPEQQAHAALAGTLHDIGKIATPSEILLKNGSLSEQEWDEMRAHSRIGAKMLERIPSLSYLAATVRAHHERMDGAGYPDRLAGKAIPMLSRIVAVADSFHAMISKRPYRDALPVPYALDELRAHTGSQWDPDVVEAMLSIVAPATSVQRTLRVADGTG